jgi:hypothetical protein
MAYSEKSTMSARQRWQIDASEASGVRALPPHNCRRPVRKEVDVVIVGVPVIHRRIPPSDGGLTMTIHPEDRRDPNREDGLYLQALRTIAPQRHRTALSATSHFV